MIHVGRGNADRIHPYDLVDALGPKSLCRKEADKGLRVAPWDGTVRMTTAPLLWRPHVHTV